MTYVVCIGLGVGVYHFNIQVYFSKYGEFYNYMTYLNMFILLEIEMYV